MSRANLGVFERSEFPDFLETLSNLFDKKYANAVTSTRSTFGAGPRKVYYPANGRSVYAGIKYTF